MPNANDAVGAANNVVAAFESYTTSKARINPREESAKVEKESISVDIIESASTELALTVKKVSDTDLSFSVENELNKMVVVVRAVGSDEIIRQFPPEEFITVAKFIAQQNPDEISDELLKGILFDNYT